MSKSANKARYNLHYKVRKQGFRLIAKYKTVYVKSNKPFTTTKQLQRLVNEFGYAIQTELA